MDSINDVSLRVIKGNVTDEELAALVTVFTALASQSISHQRKPVPEWNAPHRAIRKPLVHGPHAWRRSALPH